MGLRLWAPLQPLIFFESRSNTMRKGNYVYESETLYQGGYDVDTKFCGDRTPHADHAYSHKGRIFYCKGR